jgi:hypothetical protein
MPTPIPDPPDRPVLIEDFYRELAADRAAQARRARTRESRCRVDAGDHCLLRAASRSLTWPTRRSGQSVLLVGERVRQVVCHGS